MLKGAFKMRVHPLNTMYMVFVIILFLLSFYHLVFLILTIIIIIMSLKHGLPGNHPLAVFTVEQTGRVVLSETLPTVIYFLTSKVPLMRPSSL